MHVRHISKIQMELVYVKSMERHILQDLMKIMVRSIHALILNMSLDRQKRKKGQLLLYITHLTNSLAGFQTI